eukprot:TCONS_00060599-protein
MGDVNFEDLLNRAEQLTADVDTGTELPRIQRNLPQLAEASQRLLSRTLGGVGETSDVQASLLLSTKGIEVPKLSQRLESLNTTKTFEPIEPVIETDIHGFLKNERENAILATIEETKRRTFEESEKLFMDSLEDEWEREKQKILNSLLGAGKQAMSFPMDSSRFEEAAITKGRSSLTSIEMGYARQVFLCNESTLQGKKCNYVESFKQVSQKFNDQNVKDTWGLIEHLVTNLPKPAGSTLKLRQSKDFQAALVKNAKIFLENRYRDFVENCVYSNLQQAKLGGIPGLYNLVQSFLKIKVVSSSSGFEDGLVNGVPVWPLIYFCLRCGDKDATQRAAEGLPPQYGEFKTSLKEYLTSPDNRLHPNNEAKIKLQYKRVIRSSPDPFKRIIFCIIGHCDANEAHTEVAKKTEDYIWLKLNQIDFATEDEDIVTLPRFQKLLHEEYGESHFRAFEQPYLYAQVLFLTGQFEAAIEFLSRQDHCRCHAIHIGIALHAENLLLVPNAIHSSLLSADPNDPVPLKRLNYPRLITIYTRKFEVTDPREALEYFYLLRNIDGANGDDLFASCVSELTLETREFETILGSVNHDGSKKPGCVSKFKLDVKNIVSTIAKDAENKGSFEDAAMLYDLADNHEKVLELLSNLICQFVALANSPKSSRERIQTMARGIAERYKTRGHDGSRSRSSTFYLLVDLMFFFDLYHQKQNEEALDVIQKIKLIPLSMEEVEQKVNSFKQYSDEIRQCMPDVLLKTMNILYEKFKQSRSTLRPSVLGIRKEKDETYTTDLKTKARALVTFAGLLPYRMPGDTNARLVQLEVMMH